MQKNTLENELFSRKRSTVIVKKYFFIWIVAAKRGNNYFGKEYYPRC